MKKLYRDKIHVRKEKKKIMNTKHEMNMEREQMHRSEQALDRKQKELAKTGRRLSQDLSSQAAKIAHELGTDAGNEIDEKVKFDNLILDQLSRSINFKNVLTTQQRKGDDQQQEVDR